MEKFYEIYHAIEPGLKFTELVVQKREYAGMVSADSLEDAFKMSQNDFNTSWDTRSTSIGDIIVRLRTNEAYLVVGTGFKKVQSPQRLNGLHKETVGSNIGQKFIEEEIREIEDEMNYNDEWGI